MIYFNILLIIKFDTNFYHQNAKNTSKEKGKRKAIESKISNFIMRYFRLRMHREVPEGNRHID